MQKFIITEEEKNAIMSLYDKCIPSVTIAQANRFYVIVQNLPAVQSEELETKK